MRHKILLIGHDFIWLTFCDNCPFINDLVKNCAFLPALRHNTWEPEKNILDKSLIDSYQRSESRKRKGPSRPQSPPAITEVKKPRDVDTDGARLSEPLTVNVASAPPPKNSIPAAHSGSSSVGAATASSVGSPRTIAFDNSNNVSNSGNNDVSSEWRMESRLRPTTLLVTAASASAANTRMATKAPSSEHGSRASISPQFPVSWV